MLVMLAVTTIPRIRSSRLDTICCGSIAGYLGQGLHILPIAIVTHAMRQVVEQLALPNKVGWDLGSDLTERHHPDEDPKVGNPLFLTFRCPLCMNESASPSFPEEIKRKRSKEHQCGKRWRDGCVRAGEKDVLSVPVRGRVQNFWKRGRSNVAHPFYLNDKLSTSD